MRSNYIVILGVFLLFSGSFYSFYQSTKINLSSKDPIEIIENIEQQINLNESSFFPKIRQKYYEALLVNFANAPLEKAYAISLMDAGQLEEGILSLIHI